MNSEREMLKNGLIANTQCLSLDELQSFLDGNASETIKDHVATCSACQTETAMLRNFQSDSVPEADKASIRWIEKQVRKRSLVAPSHSRYWNMAFAGGLGCALVLMGIIFGHRASDSGLPLSNDGNLAVLRSDAFTSLSPEGDLNEKPRELRWTAGADAHHFEVKLLQVDRSVLWSGITSNNSIVIPDDVRAKILPFKVILWEVTAIDQNGKDRFSSPVQHFRLTH